MRICSICGRLFPSLNRTHCWLICDNKHWSSWYNYSQKCNSYSRSQAFVYFIDLDCDEPDMVSEPLLWSGKTAKAFGQHTSWDGIISKCFDRDSGWQNNSAEAAVSKLFPMLRHFNNWYFTREGGLTPSSGSSQWGCRG